MYTVAMYLKDIGSYPTFYEAFKAFYEAVKASIKEGTSYQALETACWIEHNNEPLYLYQARDLAYKLGILKGEGDLQEVPPDQQIPPEVFEAFWELVQLGNDIQLLEELTKLFEKFSIHIGDLTSTTTAEES